ncbi:hypothetical protein Kisp01_11520 [Kineosporia sp. NBRC 101677]|nr:hypothetical protein Kisp01_11520 [Kineosporia sp. NBRC 101677]
MGAGDMLATLIRRPVATFPLLDRDKAVVTPMSGGPQHVAPRFGGRQVPELTGLALHREGRDVLLVALRDSTLTHPNDSNPGSSAGHMTSLRARKGGVTKAPVGTIVSAEMSGRGKLNFARGMFAGQ